MNPLVFARVGRWRVKIDGSVVSRLRSFAQTCSEDLEAGGLLLGRELIGSGDYVVDDVTVPMSGDRQARTSFFRSVLCHQREVSRAWRDSGGTRIYLGEWHTHPELRPHPSQTDWKDWRLRLRQPGLQVRYVVFLIIGTHEVRAWMGDREGQTLDRLSRWV